MNRIERFASEYGSDSSRIRSNGFACLIRDNECGRRTGPVKSGHWARQSFGRLVSLYVIKVWQTVQGCCTLCQKKTVSG